MELGRTNELDPYAGYVVDDSDLEYSECSDNNSSGDELDHIQATRQQNSRVTCSAVEKDSDDEFEQEMNNEADRLLDIAMGRSQCIEKGPESFPDPVKHENPADGEESTIKEETNIKYYDEIYFDSSDEERPEVHAKGKKGSSDGKKILKLSNDELFYDPNMDDDDERWVERQRQSYHNVHISAKLKNKKKPPSEKEETSLLIGATPETTPIKATPSHPSSDAILNCPACMTTLCLDCQRHDLYYNQYRAMYVLNCKIIKDEVLKYCPRKQTAKGKRKKPDRETTDKEDVYKSVRCNVCDTEVAVHDNDEIFHFFNVIAGAP